MRLAHHLDQHVEAAAMRHAEHDLLHAEIAAALDDLLERRDRPSAPSRPKRLVPVNLVSQNFSKPSASTSLLRMARRPSGVKLISLSGPSMRSWIHAFCAALVMCMNSTPSVWQ